jgi:hypothetical protein
MTDAINNTDTDLNAPESSGPYPQTDSVVGKTSARRSKSNQRNSLTESTMANAVNTIDKETNPPTDSDRHPSTDRVGVKTSTNNIFADLAALRLSDADTANLSGAGELLSHVPVRKPNRHEFFRVHPDPEMSLVTTVFLDKEENETFFVAPEMRQVLVGETKPVLLITAITTQNVVMIIPVSLPVDGRTNPWQETAREAAERAKTDWVRMASDKQLGAYRIYKAEGELSEPVWPAQSFNELLDIAFRDRIIKQTDHPVVRRLRGMT